MLATGTEAKRLKEGEAEAAVAQQSRACADAERGALRSKLIERAFIAKLARAGA